MTSPTTPSPERSPWNLVIGEGLFSVIAPLPTTIGKHPFLGFIIAELEGKYKGIAGLNYVNTVPSD